MALFFLLLKVLLPIKLICLIPTLKLDIIKSVLHEGMFLFHKIAVHFTNRLNCAIMIIMDIKESQQIDSFSLMVLTKLIWCYGFYMAENSKGIKSWRFLKHRGK